MIVYRPCSNCSMPVITGPKSVVIRHDCSGCGGYAPQENETTQEEKAA